MRAAGVATRGGRRDAARENEPRERATRSTLCARACSSSAVPSSRGRFRGDLSWVGSGVDAHAARVAAGVGELERDCQPEARRREPRRHMREHGRRIAAGVERVERVARGSARGSGAVRGRGGQCTAVARRRRGAAAVSRRGVGAARCGGVAAAAAARLAVARRQAVGRRARARLLHGERARLWGGQERGEPRTTPRARSRVRALKGWPPTIGREQASAALSWASGCGRRARTRVLARARTCVLARACAANCSHNASSDGDGDGRPPLCNIWPICTRTRRSGSGECTGGAMPVVGGRTSAGGVGRLKASRQKSAAPSFTSASTSPVGRRCSSERRRSAWR